MILNIIIKKGGFPKKGNTGGAMTGGAMSDNIYRAHEKSKQNPLNRKDANLALILAHGMIPQHFKFFRVLCRRLVRSTEPEVTKRGNVYLFTSSVRRLPIELGYGMSVKKVREALDACVNAGFIRRDVHPDFHTGSDFYIREDIALWAVFECNSPSRLRKPKKNWSPHEQRKWVKNAQNHLLNLKKMIKGDSGESNSRQKEKPPAKISKHGGRKYSKCPKTNKLRKLKCAIGVPPSWKDRALKTHQNSLIFFKNHLIEAKTRGKRRKITRPSYQKLLENRQTGELVGFARAVMNIYYIFGYNSYILKDLCNRSDIVKVSKTSVRAGKESLLFHSEKLRKPPKKPRDRGSVKKLLDLVSLWKLAVSKKALCIWVTKFDFNFIVEQLELLSREARRIEIRSAERWMEAALKRNFAKERMNCEINQAFCEQYKRENHFVELEPKKRYAKIGSGYEISYAVNPGDFERTIRSKFQMLKRTREAACAF